MSSPVQHLVQPVGVVEDRRGDYVWLRDGFQPNLKQRVFNATCELPYPVQEILIHGAVRSGKTQVGMKKFVAWAMKYPRTTWVMFRKTRQELEDSTKKILLDGVEMPPVLPPQLVDQRWDSEKLNKVRLVNGSEILFRSLEPGERGKIRNFTVAGMLIDQVEELDDDDTDEPYYVELVGRITDPRTPRKMILIANPGPETHWVCRRFGLTPEMDALRSPALRNRTRSIHVTILDNAHNLHPQVVESYMSTRETDPAYFQQMVMGRWGSFGGRRFECWRPHLHLFKAGDLPAMLPSEWEYVEAGDWGSDNPTAWLWSAIDYMGRWWVLHEHYQRKWTVKEHAEVILNTRRNEGVLPWTGELQPSAVYLDPSAWNKPRPEISSIADAFVEHGVWVQKAQNERIGGWNRLEEYLKEIMPDGFPRLRIFEGCTNLKRELPNLKVKPGTDDVEKEHDHTPDALRYKLMSRFPTPVDKAAEPPDRTREGVLRRKVEKRKTLAAAGARPVRI